MSFQYNRKSLPARQPARPFPWLPWAASVVFLIGVIAALITVAVALVADDDPLHIRVLDAGSTTALAGAVVDVNGQQLVADATGRVKIDTPAYPMRLAISHEGYLAKAGTVEEGDTRGGFTIVLRPDVQPEVAEGAVGAPPPDGDASTGDGITDLTGGASTASSGAGSTVQASPDDEEAVPFAGTVRDIAGAPVQGAVITDGTRAEVTGTDGVFQFSMDDVTAESIRVFAPGYAEQHVPRSDISPSAEIELAPQVIKGLYFNPNISNTQEDIDRLVNIINTTELNAMVIDIKEELIFYDSSVQFFVDADTIRPIFDLTALLATLEEHDIYAIARLVVFKDSLVAEAYPDMAVMNSETGEVWRDMNGVAWVNPMNQRLWDANIELAVEASNLGFDEIQYDYVRFPTDGDLSTMDFGLEYTEENRVNAVGMFLEQSRQALLPTGAKLSADVFGYTLLVPDDLGIGQDITRLAPHVDYLSPMVYPSHFPDGGLGLDGHPNDFPYETIEISMSTGKEQLGSALQLRPWLQDFDFWDMTPYGPAEVRAQIDATEDVGGSGWLLWDPNNAYTVDALGPEDGNLSLNPSVDLVALLPGTASGKARARQRLPE